MGIRRDLPLCGIHLQRTTMYIGILDAALGTITAIVVTIHVHQQLDPIYKKNKLSSSKSPLHLLSLGYLITMLVVSVIQFAMGFVIYIGAAKPSLKMCNFWMVVTALSSLLTWFLLRIMEMVIVYKFIQQLKEYEKRRVNELIWEPPPYSNEVPQVEPQPTAFIIPHPAGSGV